MKKIFALILAILMITVSFASCNRNTDDTPVVPSETVTQQPIVQTPQDDVNGDTNTDVGDESVGDSNDENADDENSENNENDENNENNEDDSENDNDCSHEGGEDATCITESICDLCNQPYGGFDMGVHEGDEVWETTATTHQMIYECCGKVIEEEANHTYVDGVCSVCEYACAEHDSDGHSCKKCNAFVAHSYVNNKCSVCGLTRNGKIVTFGSYPQVKVTSSTVLSALNNKAGTPKTNAAAWTTYNYAGYSGMYYIDVEYSGAKYRGVYMTSYRPNNFDNTFTQQTNGYSLNTVYWFEYKAIEWTILEENNGKALIFCNMIIDTQEFDSGNSNSYAESTIRAWLNNEFYNTAFAELQKGVIANTLVDNDGESTGYNPPRFSSDDTNDNVFLLSRADVKNTSYGFINSGEIKDAARMKNATDYAMIQGASTSTKDGATNSWWWWLRTAAPKPNTTVADDLGDFAHRIPANGTMTSGSANTTTGGVIPAMWIYI